MVVNYYSSALIIWPRSSGLIGRYVLSIIYRRASITLNCSENLKYLRIRNFKNLKSLEKYFFDRFNEITNLFIYIRNYEIPVEKKT